MVGNRGGGCGSPMNKAKMMKNVEGTREPQEAIKFHKGKGKPENPVLEFGL
jgi:hypothetical protein